MPTPDSSETNNKTIAGQLETVLIFKLNTQNLLKCNVYHNAMITFYAKLKWQHNKSLEHGFLK